MTLDDYRADLAQREKPRALRRAGGANATPASASPRPPPRRWASNPTGDPNCTVHASLLGIPAISLPVLQDEGLPLGLQVTGFIHGDAATFAAAAAIKALFLARDKVRCGGAMDDRSAARALTALERYRDGPPAQARSYPDLHEHVLALAREGLLVVVDEPINKDTEMHPLVRWQYRGGIPERERKAFLFTQPTDSKGRRYDSRGAGRRARRPTARSIASVSASRSRRSARPGSTRSRIPLAPRVVNERPARKS